MSELKNIYSEKIILSKRDFKRFIKYLENPPEPTESLKELMRKSKTKYNKS